MNLLMKFGAVIFDNVIAFASSLLRIFHSIWFLLQTLYNIILFIQNVMCAVFCVGIQNLIASNPTLLNILCVRLQSKPRPYTNTK